MHNSESAIAAAVSLPPGIPARPLTRDRAIEMLNNYADGTYQAISPDVCRAAARFLANSTPNAEPEVSGDGGSAI